MTPFAGMAALLAQADPEALVLTPAGWTVMIASIGTVLSLVSYCLYRVLTLPPVEEHLKGPLDIDTRDTVDAD
jgi:hypothetical protein